MAGVVNAGHQLVGVAKTKTTPQSRPFHYEHLLGVINAYMPITQRVNAVMELATRYYEITNSNILEWLMKMEGQHISKL